MSRVDARIYAKPRAQRNTRREVHERCPRHRRRTAETAPRLSRTAAKNFRVYVRTKMRTIPRGGEEPRETRVGTTFTAFIV